MTEFVPQGDPVLARFFARYGVAPGFSKIVETDIVATAFNRERIGHKRIVVLECRHRAVTASSKKMICPRCVELMRHGFDYEGWIANREGFYQRFDGLIWRQDPCRGLNENTDLEGNFVDDPGGKLVEKV